MFFGLIFEGFRRWEGIFFEAISHVVLLHKRQNMLENFSIFFVLIVNRVFGAFGGFFVEKYFFGKYLSFEDKFFKSDNREL